jgi:transitional endoplasmic reticulum ATPase
MAALGMQAGDTVQIRGKRPAVARVMPAFAAERGKGLLQMDGILRENAQAGLGEMVQVQKLSCPTAHAVALAPLASPSALTRALDPRQVGRALEGVAIGPGDKVRATFLGGRYQEFSVVLTDPQGPVVIGPLTSTRVKGESITQREKAGCARRSSASGR